MCESPRLGSEDREPQPIYAIVFSIVTKSLPEVTPAQPFLQGITRPARVHHPSSQQAAPEDLNGEGKAS